MSKFKALQSKLETKGKGMGANEAAAIAADAGRKKYGKKGMAKKAALGRKKAAARKDPDNDND